MASEHHPSENSIEKYDEAKRILDKGIVMVHCDPRHAGVCVPAHLSEDPVVRLNFAYGFQLPGFEVDEEGISGVLNFNGLRFHCVIPWETVFAVTAPEFGHEGQFWPEDAPPEVLVGIQEEIDEQTRQKPSALRLVADGDLEEAGGLVASTDVVEEAFEEPALEESASEESVLEEPKTAPSRGHLRLVTD